MFLFLFFINFIVSVCGDKEILTKPSCQSKRIINCSCQMHGEDWSACRATNCFDYENFFSVSSIEQPHHPNSKRNYDFKVDAVPYDLCVHRMQHYPFPAINLTFFDVSSEITGFVLYFFDDIAYSKSNNICRVLHFATLPPQHQHVSLSYNCLTARLNSSNHFQLHIRAIPMNKELAYKLFLPQTNEIETTTACSWMPLIMVPLESLSENTVEVKFSQAPTHLNITNYEVLLNRKNNGKFEVARRIFVKEKLDHRSIEVVFKDIAFGYYYISVKPIMADNDDECHQQKYLMIFVEGKSSVDKTVFYVCSITACGILLGLCIFLFFKKICKQKNSSFPNSVLLVYSYDFDEHEAAVETLCVFLKQFCNDVTTIYSRNMDPNEWLDENYQNASVIIFVISYGAFHKLQNMNKPPMIEKHSWGDRFSLASRLIHSEIHNISFTKKIIRIYFEYSKIHQIPQMLQSSLWGKIFELPKEINQFVNYLGNDVSSRPCFSSSKFSLRHIVHPTLEMSILLRTVKQAKDALKKDPSLFFESNCKRVTPVHNKSKDHPVQPTIHLKPKVEEVEEFSKTPVESHSLELRPSVWDALLRNIGTAEVSVENTTNKSPVSFWDAVCPLVDEDSMSTRTSNSSQESITIFPHCHIPNSNEQNNFWSNFEEHSSQV